MRIRSQRQNGSVLMICLITTAILGTTLAAYLDLISAQNVSVARSQSWNAAIPTLEFGIEEALAQLNQNGDTDLALDGWSQDGIQFSKFRAIGSSQVFVVISNASPPVIYAYGYVPVPLQNSNYVERVVRVKTSRNSLFTKAILSQGQITMNGNGLVDSFDSSDPNFSTNGLYDPARHKAGGGIASNSGLTNVLLTGNASIYGNLDTGPGGSVGIGPNGKVGNLDWMTNSSVSGLQPGASRDDMNVAFPDVVPPFSTAVAPGSGPGYQYNISASGNYQVPSISGSVLVRSNVNAILLVDGDISLNGSKSIEIQSGASLQIYMKGQSADIGGSGVVNHNGAATNFMFWGLPSNQQLTISGNGQFTGVVYAPQAAFTLNGGGSSEGIVGAAVSLTASINGHFQFHYDESLARLIIGRGFVATSWDEL